MNECVLILSGGNSSRMRQNKALLPFLGKTLIERQVQDALCAGFNVLLASDGEKYNLSSTNKVVYIQDRLPEKQGPLSALLSALTHIQAQGKQGLWVMACDNLLLPSQLFDQLKKHHPHHLAWQNGIVCFQDHQHIYPLIAYWTTKAIIPLNTYLQQGKRRVIPFIDSLEHAFAPLPEHWQTLCHFNTPEAFTQAKKDWKNNETQSSK